MTAGKRAEMSLTEDQSRLLDSVGFTEDRQALIAASIEAAGHAARLTVTAFTAAEVAAGLGISDAELRQKKLDRRLWAIPDGQSWVFPVLQFETGDTGAPARQVRGLDGVFPALPDDLHPAAVAGFLTTQQPDLVLDRPMTPLEWLRAGGEVDRVARGSH